MKRKKRYKKRFNLRSRARLIAAWVIILLTLVAGNVAKYCYENPEGHCENQIRFWLPVFVLAALCLMGWRGYFHFLQKGLMLPTDTLSPFAKSPAKYHKKIIRLRGRVRKVLKDTTKEKLIRQTRDLYRTAIGNEDRTDRYIHQRVIIESPALKKGETIIIYHNVKYGKKAFKPGVWIEVSGEYIHPEPSEGQRARAYGLIHYTHEPKGNVKILKKYPDREMAVSLSILDEGE